jgi:hypothetical protein
MQDLELTKNHFMPDYDGDPEQGLGIIKSRQIRVLL